MEKRIYFKKEKIDSVLALWSVASSFSQSTVLVIVERESGFKSLVACDCEQRCGNPNILLLLFHETSRPDILEMTPRNLLICSLQMPYFYFARINDFHGARARLLVILLHM